MEQKKDNTSKKITPKKATLATEQPIVENKEIKKPKVEPSTKAEPINIKAIQIKKAKPAKAVEKAIAVTEEKSEQIITPAEVIIPTLSAEKEKTKTVAKTKAPAAKKVDKAPAEKKPKAVKKAVEKPTETVEKIKVKTISSTKTTETAKAKSILFNLKYRTNIGETIWVTGDHPILGNNDKEQACPLEFFTDELWQGKVEFSVDSNIDTDIRYKYFVKKIDGTISEEHGQEKTINPGKYTASEIVLLDCWNYAGFFENTFYTKPFEEIFLNGKLDYKAAKPSADFTHTFIVKAPLLSKNQVLCLIGDIPELGAWANLQPLLMTYNKIEGTYSAEINIENEALPVYYKYGVFDFVSNEFIRFEDGNNRLLTEGTAPDKQTIINDGFAVLPNNSFKGAGVAIPVFSLRTNDGFGTGEFNDLKKLADWGKKAGLKAIQILPVNDTTATHTQADSYPYAAISSFALHPLYLNLTALAGSDKKLLKSITDEGKKMQKLTALDYAGVMEGKRKFIKQLFSLNKNETFESPAFKLFFKENENWLKPYAVFCQLRDKYKTADFNKWKTDSAYNAEKINKLTNNPATAADDIAIHLFTQYHLHEQLKEAAAYVHQQGLMLKGDIAIGVYKNSVDAWMQPELFNLDMQAGAPPDQFSEKGQNWGFPTYNWEKMKENGFEWWKNRFGQMNNYFDAFRIDHILGFFRMWSIPMEAVEGILGYFVPANAVHVSDFAKRGINFDYNRFTTPFINDAVLFDAFEEQYETIKEQYFSEDTHGNIFFKEEFNTQRKIQEHFYSLEETNERNKLKQGLFNLISNVMLIEPTASDKQTFHFRISMPETSSFKYLQFEEQAKVYELYVDYFYHSQEELWKKEALEKLPELKNSTNMLICGEDLGMMADCVPQVMKDLGILTLEIQRSPKSGDRPFFRPGQAPYLSVITPGTHDMSTLRGWWLEDRERTKLFYNFELGEWGDAPENCEPRISKTIIQQHLFSPAMWSIFQIQDLLGMDETLRIENPDEERINNPSDNAHVWKYRMNINLEDLAKKHEFNSALKEDVQLSGR